MQRVNNGTNLKERVLSGAVWAFLGQTGQYVLVFAISIVLARLLNPDVFGLIAMLTVFLSLAGSLVDGGWAAALIQKARIEPEELGSVFVINFVTGLLLTATFWLVAPLIAAFFHEPTLCSLIRFLSLQFPINALGLVQWALIKRRLDFRTESMIRLGGTLSGGIVGMWGAWNGWGVWSLAAQALVQSCVRTGLFFWRGRWTPVWILRWTALRGLLPYSLHMLGVALLENVVSRLDYLLIGRFFCARDLGLYNRAWALKDLPAENISGVVNQVMFPVLSRTQHDAVMMQQALRRSLRATLLVVTPLLIVMSVSAGDFIRVVYSERWSDSAPYLGWLCLGAVFGPSVSVGVSYVLAIGRADVYLRFSLVRALSLAIAFSLGVIWGIIGILVCWLLAQLLIFLLFGKILGRLANYGWRDQARDFLPVLGLAAVSGLVAVQVSSLLAPQCTHVRLALTIGIFAASYLCTCCLFRIESFRDLVTVLGKAIFKAHPQGIG